jgi:hypothetical protein
MQHRLTPPLTMKLWKNKRCITQLHDMEKPSKRYTFPKMEACCTRDVFASFKKNYNALRDNNHCSIIISYE